MNFKKISAVAIIMIATFFVALQAQPNEKAPVFIKNYGFSGFGVLDYTSPIYKDGNQLKRAIVPSILSISWSWRANLIESGDHFSLSIETNPIIQLSGAGLHNGFVSLGAFELPIMLGINWGTAATFRSVDFKGGGLSAGISVLKYPLLSVDVFALNDAEPNFPSFNMLYCFSYKFRKWTMKSASEGRAKSVEMYFAFSNVHADSDIRIDGGFFTDRTVRAGLVYRKFLNY